MTRTLLTVAILFICAAALALGSDDGYLRTEPVANLTISTTGTEVLLSWDAVPDATAYKVYSCSTPDGAFSEDLNGVFNGASWTVPITASPEFYHVTALIDPGTMVFVAGGTIYPTTGTYTGGLTVASFYVDKHEITQAAFTAVMGSNPAEYYGVGDTYPVYNVPWYSAVEYCNRRSLLEGLDPCYSYLGSGTNPDNWPPG
ncbi:MAG: hypothetical protein PHD87_04535 [Candidatus Cloacimonetes bacterium]|nr:hypothetical protein [Candidatus Cloacimonadota bacterium]